MKDVELVVKGKHSDNNTGDETAFLSRTATVTLSDFPHLPPLLRPSTNRIVTLNPPGAVLFVYVGKRMNLCHRVHALLPICIP